MKKVERKNNKVRYSKKLKINIQYLIYIIFVFLLISIFVVFVFINIKHIFRFFDKLILILMPIIYGLIMTYLMSPLYNFIVAKSSKFFVSKKNVVVNNKSNDNKIKKENKKEIKFFGFLSIKKVFNNKNTKKQDNEDAKKKKENPCPKILATVVCVVTVLVIVFGIIALVLPQLIDSSYKFAIDLKNFPSTINNLQNTKIYSFLNNIFEKYYDLDKLQSAYSTYFNSMYQWVVAYVLPKLNDIAVKFSKGAMYTFKQLINFLIGIIVMIYVLNMKTSIINAIKKALYAIFSINVASKILEECRYAHKVFSGFLVGKLLDSLIIGILCFICCSIMKMPYELLVSVIVGVTNIIPFFGPFIGAIPSFIFIVLVDPLKGFIFLLFILILQQFDGNILGPYILGDRTGVESFYVLFSILLFGGLFGFVGMIIGVPLWAVLSKICWEFLDSRLIEKNLPIDKNKYMDK